MQEPEIDNRRGLSIDYMELQNYTSPGPSHGFYNNYQQFLIDKKNPNVEWFIFLIVWLFDCFNASIRVIVCNILKFWNYLSFCIFYLLCVFYLLCNCKHNNEFK